MLDASLSPSRRLTVTQAAEQRGGSPLHRVSAFEQRMIWQREKKAKRLADEQEREALTASAEA